MVYLVRIQFLMMSAAVYIEEESPNIYIYCYCRSHEAEEGAVCQEEIQNKAHVLNLCADGVMNCANLI